MKRGVGVGGGRAGKVLTARLGQPVREVTASPRPGEGLGKSPSQLHFTFEMTKRAEMKMTSKKPTSACWKRSACCLSHPSPAAPPRFSLRILSASGGKEKSRSPAPSAWVPRPGAHQVRPPPRALRLGLPTFSPTPFLFLQTLGVLLAGYGSSPRFRTGRRNQIRFPLFLLL